MRVFVSVAELQSFRRAARKLDVSNALITRSIAMLEAHLNTRLIHRTTRNLALTEAGTRYLEGCRALLEEFDHLEASVAHAVREPVGTLRIVASDTLSPLKLAPLFDGFHRLYPKVRVQVTLAYGPIDVIDSGYDVGIIAGLAANDNPALVEHTLGQNPLTLCAASTYLKQHGEPRIPDDLARHAYIGLPLDQHTTMLRLVDTDNTAHPISLRPIYTVNSIWMVRAAVCAGTGIGVLPTAFVASALEQGELVQLMRNYRIDNPDTRLSIVYPNRQFLPARTRSFVEHALDHFDKVENLITESFSFPLKVKDTAKHLDSVTAFQ